jgi:hypothetical protein
LTKKNNEKGSILASEQEIIYNITNYDNEPDSNSSPNISSSISLSLSLNPSISPSLNFWNYLLFKPRKNNKNTKQTTLVNESKCLIVL